MWSRRQCIQRLLKLPKGSRKDLGSKPKDIIDAMTKLPKGSRKQIQNQIKRSRIVIAKPKLPKGSRKLLLYALAISYSYLENYETPKRE